MKRILKYILAVIIAATTAFSISAQTSSTKAERNFIKDGNKAFNDGNFAKALQYYNDALTVAPRSETALFNKAIALMKLAAGQDSTMIKEALQIYNTLGSGASDISIREKANYNLGNYAFNAKQYPQSIEYYKKTLRINPSNQKARQNLRVAQLKNPEQPQQSPQPQPQSQQKQQEQEKQKQQQQQQQNESDANADQILQSMQNRENQTREQSQKKQNTPIYHTDKPW